MIRAYLTDTTTQKQYKGADTWNEPIARTSVIRRCRVDYSSTLIMNESGQLVNCRAKIMLAPLVVVRTNHAARATDTIAFEDMFTVDGADYAVIQIKQQKDFRVRATEVFV